ncbi:MAG: branched-chain amino acid ABC transporter permease [Aigarchaeota archaeon]|nr:branched-chain amino acid ABC transporter permease [Aigarchaeota archaeon]MDW8092289.1 branched-chain amino acid ABC transporter permease [Nitrososphaerota archaeon]
MSIFKNRSLYLFIIATIALGLLPLVVKNSYVIYMLFIMFIFIGLSTGWNIIGGLTGQVSLGHAVFFGIGSYTTAVVWLSGHPPISGIMLGGMLAGISALLLIPTFRLRGIYFAIGTLFLNEVTKQVFLNWDAVGGGVGLYLPIPTVFVLEPFYYTALAYCLVTALVALFVHRSKLGLTLNAIREDETAASVLGIRILPYKILALVISAVIFGIGGGVYTSYQTYIEPHSTFHLEWGIGPVFMAILGGFGTFLGPILGAVVYTLIGQSVATLANMRLLFFSIIIILVVRFMPEGLIGHTKDLVKRLVRPLG